VRNNRGDEAPIVTRRGFVPAAVTVVATSVSKKHRRSPDYLMFASQEVDSSRGEDMAADRSDEARYLRQKAKQFRELAKTYKTEISGKLMEIAQDLETRAENLEKGSRKSAAAHVQRRVNNGNGNGNRPRRYPLR
jgi:hypothetical protein